MKYQDLFEIVPDASPSYNWRDGSMYDVEDNVITLALEAAGCEILGGWYSTEKDSFGPLSRGIRVRFENEVVTVIYG